MGSSWVILGSSWVILGHPGVILGSSWGHPGSSWGHPGSFFGHPRSSWGHLGVILGSSWGHPGSSWVILGSSWGHLESSWSHPGVPSEGLKSLGALEKLSGWWVGGGTVNLTSAPGPGLCYLLRSSEIFRYLLRSDIDWTLTGPEPDLDRSLTIKGPLFMYINS